MGKTETFAVMALLISGWGLASVSLSLAWHCHEESECC